MTRTALGWVVLALVAGSAAGANAQDKKADMQKSAVAQTPEWLTIKSLVGSWGGVVEIEGKQVPTSVEMRLTGDGSDVMHVMDRDTPHEMVTMFDPDGGRLLATHYCAAHNQPRMALVPGPAPNQLTFDFVAGTNMEPGDGHMSRLVLTVTDADHHDETWAYVEGGKETPPMTFSYTRKK